MTPLRYSLYGTAEYGETRHPQVVMRELGITYQHATPQSITDCWIFWNCENVPKDMPKFITRLDISPHTWVGLGLSEKMADEIVEYRKQKTQKETP